MKSLRFNEIDARWEGLADRFQRLKHLDLSVEDDLEQALEESQRLLGAIAHCRHLMVQARLSQEEPPRRAA